MKKAFETLLINIANLFKIKNIVTLSVTYIMIMLVIGKIKVAPEVLALFSISYGGIMAYFFNKDKVVTGKEE